jgi:hypothetical protein
MKIWRETSGEVIDPSNIPIQSVLNESNHKILDALEEDDNEDELGEDNIFSDGGTLSTMNSNDAERKELPGEALGPQIETTGEVSVGSAASVPIAREISDNIVIHRNFRIPLDSIPANAERAEFEEMWSAIMEEEYRKKNSVLALATQVVNSDYDSALADEGGLICAAENLHDQILERNWFRPMKNPDTAPSGLINDEWMLRKPSDNVMDKNVIMKSLELYPPIVGKLTPAHESKSSALNEQALLKLNRSMSEDFGSSVLSNSPSRGVRRQQTAVIDPLAPKKKSFSKLLKAQESKDTYRKNSSTASFLPAITFPRR